MRYLKFIIPAIIILSGCAHSNTKQREIPVIKFQPAQSIDMAQFFDTVRYLQLENNPEAPILDIDKVETSGEFIFLMDKRLRTVICYDTSGHYRYKIQDIGGVDEGLRDLDAMWIDEKHGEIMIHSFSLKKIFVFGMDGKFRSELETDWGMQDMAALENGSLVGLSTHGGANGDLTSEPGLFLINREGEVKDKAMSFGGRSIYWSINYQRYLDSYEGGVLALNQSDTLWKIDKLGNISADMVTDWGNRSLPRKLRVRRLQGSGAENFLQGNFVCGKDMLVSFGPIRLFRIFINRSEQFALADLRSGQGYYSAQVISPRNSIPLLFPIGKQGHQNVIGFINKRALESLVGIMKEEPGSPEWIKGIDISKNLLWFGRLKDQLFKY